MTQTADTAVEEAGKRVSWVELYFDVIFVFAVGQTAHSIVAQPRWGAVWTALGLFVTLWWTWIGYVVLYNRHGTDTPPRRLLVLAGTIPCALAAVQVHSAAAGHPAGFALALAAARVVLVVAYLTSADQSARVGRQISAGYALSTVLFTATAVVASPWQYLLWALALSQEAGVLLLTESRQRARERARAGRAGRGSGGRATVRRSRIESFRAMLNPPVDPSLGVDAAHLAERFGLFMIILLGEVVISVGAGALEVHERDALYWLGLSSGLILAAALWWIYFDSAADMNEYVLRASGGNPAMAYGLYAGGHLAPAFALLVVAAGVNLALLEHPSAAAAWLMTAGLAAYLVGTRAVIAGRTRYGRVARAAIVVVTVCLGLLAKVIAPTALIAVVAVWAVLLAAVVSRQRPERLRRLVEDPLSFLRDAN